ncbi:MAG TPA: hypothetical protein VIN10_14315 [Bacteroidales bacterium]
MKKIIFICLTLLISSSLFSQSDFDNKFYFRLGYSLPCWSQFGFEKDDWPDGFKRSGFMGEVGTIYMLNKVFNNDKMVLGIDVDYMTIYWYRFSNKQNLEQIDIGTLSFNSKVGPSFTFVPAKKMAIDVFVKADFSWVTATVIVMNNDSDDSEGYGKVGTVGVSTGFNVRYSLLMIGFEFNTMSPKLENVDYAGEYLGNANDPGNDKSPLPAFSFTIGMNF